MLKLKFDFFASIFRDFKPNLTPNFKDYVLKLFMKKEISNFSVKFTKLSNFEFLELLFEFLVVLYCLTDSKFFTNSEFLFKI